MRGPSEHQPEPQFTFNYRPVAADDDAVWSAWLPTPTAPRQLRISILISCVAVAFGIFTEALISVFWPSWNFSPLLDDPRVRASNLIVSVTVLSFGLIVQRLGPRFDRWLGLPFAFSALSLATYVNVSNHTGNAAGQLSAVLPVVLVAFHLTLRWAVVIGVMAVASQQVIVWTALDPIAALNDTIYVPIFLMLLSVLLGMARTNQLRMEAELRHQAEIDPLTRIATRQVLDKEIADAVGAPDGAETALLLVDLDHFKSINDTFGHPIGDQALKVVADCLKELAGHSGLAARIGGDELAVLLRGVTADQAQRLANNLVYRIRAVRIQSGTSRVRLSVSVGVATPKPALTPTSRDAVELLYAAADQALYQAKRAGRDQVGVITAPPTLDEPLLPPQTPRTQVG